MVRKIPLNPGKGHRCHPEAKKISKELVRVGGTLIGDEHDFFAFQGQRICGVHIADNRPEGQL
jgi:hypothetical protein